LKPEDQKRSIEVGRGGHGAFAKPALFADDRSLFVPDDYDEKVKEDPYFGVKAVSVREFESWIQDTIRVEPAHVDAFLFPETAAALETHADDKLKAILITREYRAGEAVRQAGKEKVFGQQSWERADGKEKSKPCDCSRLALVSCGPGQGEAFLACVNKEKCTVHWGAEIRQRKQRQTAAAAGGVSARAVNDRERWLRDEGARKEQNARDEAERKRWEKARPAILEAVATAVKKAPTKARGHLADLVIRGLDSYQARSKDVEKLVPRGTTAEDLVRHAAFIVVASQYDPHGWRAAREFPGVAKAFGVEVKKILDQAAPAEVQTPAQPASGSSDKRENARKAARKGGKA